MKSALFRCYITGFMSEFSAIQKRYKYCFNFRPGVIKVAKNIKQKSIIYTSFYVPIEFHIQNKGGSSWREIFLTILGLRLLPAKSAQKNARLLIFVTWAVRPTVS